MSPETRLAAADAFWRDKGNPDELNVQHAEATMAIARRLNFRTKSVTALPIDRRAKHLAHMSEVSEAIATRALVAYHMASQRPMMRAFLDAIGLEHDDGVITAEEVPVPAPEKLADGVAALRAAFPEPDVTLYLNTLLSIDGETWAGIEKHLT